MRARAVLRGVDGVSKEMMCFVCMIAVILPYFVALIFSNCVGNASYRLVARDERISHEDVLDKFVVRSSLHCSKMCSIHKACLAFSVTLNTAGIM